MYSISNPQGTKGTTNQKQINKREREREREIFPHLTVFAVSKLLMEFRVAVNYTRVIIPA